MNLVAAVVPLMKIIHLQTMRFLKSSGVLLAEGRERERVEVGKPLASKYEGGRKILVDIIEEEEEEYKCATSLSNKIGSTRR